MHIKKWMQIMSLLHFSRSSESPLISLLKDMQMILKMQRKARKPQEQRNLLMSGLSYEEIMERLQNTEVVGQAVPDKSNNKFELNYKT